MTITCITKQFSLVKLARSFRTTPSYLLTHSTVHIPRNTCHNSIPLRNRASILCKIRPELHISASHSIRLPLIAFIAGLFFLWCSENVTAEDEDLSPGELEQLLKELGEIGEVEPEHRSSRCLKLAYQKCHEEEWDTIDRLIPLLSRLKDPKGNTLLITAIKHSDQMVVRNLLEREVGLKEKDLEGNTPLHIAARLNSVPVISLLVGSIVDDTLFFDPNTRNKKGETPLHIAIELGHKGVLGPLVEKADLSKQNKEGNSLIHIAISCGRFQIVDYLLSKHWATLSKYIEAPNADGLIPISLAAFLGETQALYILAKKGGNIETKDAQGNTPLHWACKGGQKETIDCLMKLQASAKVANKDFAKPEHLIDTTTLQGKELATHFEFLKEDRSRAKDPLAIPIKNLVFQGGGSKGIAYIPVIKYLEEKQILDSVERVAGASAGAITAALIALGYSAEKLETEMEKQKLTDFLDPQKGFVTPKLQNRLDHLFDLYTNHSLFFAAANKAYQGVKIFKKGGACEGEVLRKWIEARIKEATGKDFCTFGELSDFITTQTPLANGNQAKHLHLFVTKIGPELKSIEINSTDKDWANVIISDAIRMSMSIPLVYQPHQIYIKNGKGERVLSEKSDYFIDGGVINNFPIHTFDYKKYKNERNVQENSNTPWHNPYTRGFSLYTPPENREVDPTLWGVGKDLASLYPNLEMIQKEQEEKSMERVTRINNQGISLLQFDIPAKKKENLLKEAEKQTKLSFQHYTLGSLLNLNISYDYKLFQEKEGKGDLFLTPPCPHFSGRKKELKVLKEILVQKTYNKEAPCTSIIADRGYGKSELALAFATFHLKDFSLIWKIDHRNLESLEKSYRKLAHTLNILHNNELPLNQLRSKVNAELEQLKTPFLLIFDNVDEGGIPPHPQKGGAILFTTTDKKTFQNKKPLYLECLKSKDGEKIMENILGEDPSIPQLAQDLRHIPLLMFQAANYISKTGTDSASYRKLLTKECSPSLTQATYHELLKACWMIAAEALHANSPKAHDWLLLSSFLDNKEIPKRWLQSFLASQDSGRPLKHYSEQLEILNFLTSYGLISSHSYDDTFSLNGYFQEIVRQSAPEETLEKLFSLMATFEEIKEYNPTDPEKQISFEKVIQHSTSVLKQAKEHRFSSKETIFLNLTLIRHLIETKRDLAKAEEYLDLTNHSIGSSNTPYLGRVQFFYGSLYTKLASQQKDLHKKRELYLKALKQFEEARATYDKHPEEGKYRGLEQNPEKCNQRYQKAICLEYQAQTLINLGDLQKATDTLDQALKEFLILYPKGEHFDIARIKREQGKVFLKQNDPASAIQKISEALEMQKVVYKHRFPSHSAVGATYSSLGQAYMQLKTYDKMKKADSAYKKAISTNEKAYRTKNLYYNTLLYEKRAEIAKTLGQVDKEKRMLTKKKAIENALANN